MRNNGIRIRVADVLYGIMKHRVLIIALTVAGLLIGVVLSGISYLRGEMSKEYIITSSFSVNTQTGTGLYTSGYDFPDYDDINMAKDLAESVSYVLKSDSMLNEVINSLGLLGVTTKDIADNLEFAPYNETQIIEATLYWRSSQEGADILSVINSRAPEILAETLGIGNVSVVNEPSARYIVGGSVNMVLWGYMAVLGLVLGIGLTLLELIMHPTLLNVQDMETVFGVEILCEIADDRAYFQNGHSLLVEGEKHSRVEESFASAAHIIQNRYRKKEGPHIIYVTSALRGEGKTNVLANLAIQLSDLENHVLLVDFDMKNPNLKRLFLKNIDYSHSLNALYEGDILENEAVTALTGYLDILPTIYEKNAIPLDSNLFAVIRKLAVNYDYVLIDTSSVGITADPMSLNQIADAALFVARYDTATMREIADALERVEKSGVRVLGCVVNGVQVSERNIKNPVQERENIQKNEYREQNPTEPLTNLKADYEEKDLAKETDSDIQSLVADFSDNGEEDEPVIPDSEILSEDDFVNLLFHVENNRTEAEPDETAREEASQDKNEEGEQE